MEEIFTGSSYDTCVHAEDLVHHLQNYVESVKMCRLQIKALAQMGLCSPHFMLTEHTLLVTIKRSMGMYMRIKKRAYKRH